VPKGNWDWQRCLCRRDGLFLWTGLCLEYRSWSSQHGDFHLLIRDQDGSVARPNSRFLAALNDWCPLCRCDSQFLHSTLPCCSSSDTISNPLHASEPGRFLLTSITSCLCESKERAFSGPFLNQTKIAI